MVVVVVPALAENEKAEREIVPRRIPRGKPLPAPKMPGRVDQQRSVERERRRDSQNPHDAWPAEGDGAHDARRHRRKPFEAIEETQLRKTREVADVRDVGVIVRAAENPAQVRVPETAKDRRMRIARTVGEAMVSTMTARPPQRAVLHRGAPKPAENELKDAAGLECVVRKVAVVARRHAESLQQVARAGEADDAPGARHEWCEQAQAVHPKNDPRRGKVDQPRMECPSNRCGFDQIDLRLRATPPDRRLVDREVTLPAPRQRPIVIIWSQRQRASA